MSTQTWLHHPQSTSAAKDVYLVALGEPFMQPVVVGDFLTIGRDPQNQVQLHDPFASMRHARIERKVDGFLLRDLRSRNGTYLNGSRVMEAQLMPGDRIRIGEKELLFQDHDFSSLSNPLLRSKNDHWNKRLQSLPIFAQSELPVLLLGGSGTGKEVLAKLVHEFSKRSQAPFVSVNCSALSESLVESELFGHVKGSFTGATHDRKGAFEAARGGTLFLDEVGDLPLSLQPKLLRALENREIRPVGSDRTIGTDVRIIAATHQNLQSKIQSGQFRSDLYFRLNVIKIHIPELRDRPEDFEDLLNHFAKEMRVRFSYDAIQELKAHKWPGNIRELRNAVARASALFPGTRIETDHLKSLIDALPAMDMLEPAKGTLPLIKELEREMIKQRLVANQGNQRKTAIDLNMPKSTLHDRIRAYGINVDELVAEHPLIGV
ncbi:MAG TPA: sigma 54-interacting transcriptional regulator [Bdellovibrionales bacterium]|nr:sigma 54-interacting transcriptional regulator [Bdellovibrionales bacterium]